MDTSTYTIADQERMAHAKNYFAWQSRLVAPELGRRVVEVGCGLGNFTRTLLDREAVIALDVERDCIERLVERYPNRPNLHAFVCDAGSDEFAGLARFRPDSCVCLNVLEHIADDRKALAAMASILAPGGAIVLLAPAFQALYGPIDWNLGHYRRYSRASISRASPKQPMLNAHCKLHYVNFAGFFGWWLNSHVFRREAQSEGQIQVFDGAWISDPVAVRGLARPPFGQSLFAVLRKP